MNAQRLTLAGVRRTVRIGQRWRHRADGQIVLIYQVHRGERLAEAYRERADPHQSRTRFPLGFGELGSNYELLDSRQSRKEAA
jgi:hypothetical protein